MARDLVYKTLGASNHTEDERQNEDFYASPPMTIDHLFQYENFEGNIWEPAVGQGHMAQKLLDRGYKVLCSDIIDRGFPDTKIKDFLSIKECPKTIKNIITNPPYNIAEKFARKAIELVPEGGKVAMLLKLLFLEGNSRAKLFKEYPPKKILIYSYRINCGKNGDFSTGYFGGAQAFTWFIWEKGYKGRPQLEWITKEGKKK